MEGLFLVQRPVSMGGWIHGNIDEVDEHVSLKKLNALQTVVENQLIEVKKKQEEDPNKKQWGESRIKWLSRYLKYFIYRQRKLKLIINGKFDESMKAEFYDHFISRHWVWRQMKIRTKLSKKFLINLMRKSFKLK